jgi:hypothetical protein
MESPWLTVTKEQHAAFIAAYPRSLTTDVSAICEPPQRTWYDFNAENADARNAYVAAETRHWLGPDGEVDETNHGRFWTYAINARPKHRGIARRVNETLQAIQLELPHDLIKQRRRKAYAEFVQSGKDCGFWDTVNHMLFPSPDGPLNKYDLERIWREETGST